MSRVYYYVNNMNKKTVKSNPKSGTQRRRGSNNSNSGNSSHSRSRSEGSSSRGSSEGSRSVRGANGAGRNTSSRTRSTGGHSSNGGSRSTGNHSSNGGSTRSAGGYSSGSRSRSTGGYSSGGNSTSRNGRGGGGNRGPRGRTSAQRGRGQFGGGRRGGGRKKSTLDISQFINKEAVETMPEAPFKPEHKFVDFKIQKELKTNITAVGYVDPTPIQDKVISIVLEGKDVVGLANTGTGKTAAFLIPIVNKILLNKREKAIILTPTRELALQIDEEFKKLTKGFGMNSVVCVGGINITPQIRQLKHLRTNVVVGTPGRVMDLMKRNVLRLNDYHTIVLDEADRMLDMGFINDMRFVMRYMPKDRHTLFFSATMSPEIEEIVGSFLIDPTIISVKTRSTAKNIAQDIVKTKGQDKIEVLHDLLNKPEFTRVLIFGRTKHGVEKLSKKLIQRGFKAESIHGDKSHAHRQRSLKKFKDGIATILVATDVAARGLDINDVSHVINYELPESYDDYVHRIGRTGRGDKKGQALTFVD